MKLEYTRNDLPEAVRCTAVALLNQQLADAIDLGLQAKQAHWNVKGPHFISLHEFFDDVAEEVEIFSDLLAERAVQLGGLADGTAQRIVRDSRLPAYAAELYRGTDQVRALAVALSRFAMTVRRAIADAERAGDSDTADVFTHVSRISDSLLWKVSSHIPEDWERASSEPLVPEGSIAADPTR